ncbi:RNA helicase [Aphelenchoides besseyi]|nr:RNA helicase [Aphelenchoides besseyi]
MVVSSQLRLLIVVVFTISLSWSETRICDDEQRDYRKTEIFQAVDTCYKERPSSNACKNLHIEQYQPLNLLLNIARAFNNLGAEERRSFREATRRLIGRVDACNPAISDQLKRSMEHLNYRNESICPTKQQVCQQNTAYLYPMYCTFRKHLNCQDRCEDQKFEFQLQLFYATTYALQMISAETNQPLRPMTTFGIDGGGGTFQIWLIFWVLLVVGGSMAEPDFSCTYNGQPWKPDLPGDWFPKDVQFHPICPGDFKEYFEMWEVNDQFQPAWYDHTTIFYIGNTKKKGNQVLYNGLYFSLYGTDEYVFSEDVPPNDNIWIWTKTQDGSEDYVQKGLCQDPKPIEQIPPYELSFNMRQKVKQYCEKNYCAIDMDSDGSSMVMDKEHRIVVHKGGMDLIAKVHKVDEKNYPYYVLRYAGLWFYFPKNLPTFKDPEGFVHTHAKDKKWDNRYVLLPIIGQNEVFFARREIDDHKHNYHDKHSSANYYCSIEEEATTPDYEEVNSAFKSSVNAFVLGLWLMVLVSCHFNLMADTFKSLGVNQWLVDQLKQLNVTRPSPVQSNCIPQILNGSDVLGCSKTGTGKTIAFAAPILQKLAVDPYGIFALVVAPTRELVFQIAEQFSVLGKPINVRVCTITGGRQQIAQARQLSEPHIVVASPGRLADHLESDPEVIGKLFRQIQYFVLDEADQLLDGQYAVDLKTIVEHIPTKRQTLLFSATITSALSQLHQISVNKPFMFQDERSTVTADKLDQHYVLCPLGAKDSYVAHVVKMLFNRLENSLVLIFVRNCKECHILAVMLRGLGFETAALHSELTQQQRLNALNKFRSSQAKILVCTDVASRGLDIPRVDVVINHNVPEKPKTYVHRVGRSARADRFGSAITFVTQYELDRLHEIEAHIRVELQELKIDAKQLAKDATSVFVLRRESEIRVERRWREQKDPMFDVRIPSLSFLFGSQSVEAAECRHLSRGISLISWPVGRLSARRSYLSDAVLLNQPVGVKIVIECNILKRMNGKIKHYDFGLIFYIVDMTRHSYVGMQVKAWLQSSDQLKFELQGNNEYRLIITDLDEWTSRELLDDKRFIFKVRKEFPATMKKLGNFTLFMKVRPFTSLVEEYKSVCNNPVHHKFSHCLGQALDSDQYTDTIVEVNGESFKEICANSLGQNLSLKNILNRLELVEIYGELIDFKHRVFTFAKSVFAEMKTLPEWSDFCDQHPHVLVELLLNIQTEAKPADTTISEETKTF